jgi:HlyD family secretion protein
MNARIGVALAVALAFACSDAPSELPSLGTLERERMELSAPAAETIVEIAVREGDRVAADALLVRLDAARVRAEVDRVQASRDQARARLAELERGPRYERIAEARARLASARSTAAMVARDLERARTLAAQDFTSKAELDQLEARRASSDASVDEARAALEALERGNTSEEIAQARSAFAAAEAVLSETKIRLADLEVRAPVAGQVDALPFEIGERPPVGAIVVALLADTAPYARVHVPAPVRVRLESGVRATIHVDGRDEPFEGTLRSVAHDASFTPYFALSQRDRSRLSYLAEVVLDDPAARDLPSGIPVEVFFDADQLAGR